MGAKKHFTMDKSRCWNEGNKRRSLESDDSVDSAHQREEPGFGGDPRLLACDDSFRASNTLDDEFVRDCSNGSTSACPELKMEVNGIAEALPGSFLNMSHLSISLRDDFDGGEAPLTPTKDRSFSLREDLEGGDDEQPLTPMKNRSFTSSCASIERTATFSATHLVPPTAQPKVAIPVDRFDDCKDDAFPWDLVFLGSRRPVEVHFSKATSLCQERKGAKTNKTKPPLH